MGLQTGTKGLQLKTIKYGNLIYFIFDLMGHRPLRSRCPANIKQSTILDKQQGKGTDDHILPLGI